MNVASIQRLKRGSISRFSILFAKLIHIQLFIIIFECCIAEISQSSILSKNIIDFQRFFLHFISIKTHFEIFSMKLIGLKRERRKWKMCHYRCALISVFSPFLICYNFSFFSKHFIHFHKLATCRYQNRELKSRNKFDANSLNVAYLNWSILIVHWITRHTKYVGRMTKKERLKLTRVRHILLKKRTSGTDNASIREYSRVLIKIRDRFQQIKIAEFSLISTF